MQRHGVFKPRVVLRFVLARTQLSRSRPQLPSLRPETLQYIFLRAPLRSTPLHHSCLAFFSFLAATIAFRVLLRLHRPLALFDGETVAVSVRLTFESVDLHRSRVGRDRASQTKQQPRPRNTHGHPAAQRLTGCFPSGKEMTRHQCFE